MKSEGKDKDRWFGEASLLQLQHTRMQSVSAGGALVAGRPCIQTFTFDGTYTIPRT